MQLDSNPAPLSLPHPLQTKRTDERSSFLISAHLNLVSTSYDRHDKGWEALMDAMAACQFEGDDGSEKLIQALRERLKNQSALYKDATVQQWIAIALNNLGFMERGL